MANAFVVHSVQCTQSSQYTMLLLLLLGLSANVYLLQQQRQRQQQREKKLDWLTTNIHTSAASVPYERIVSGWRLCNIKTIYACYKQWLLNGPELQTGFFYSQYPIQRSTTKCRLFYSDESFSFHSLIGNMQTLKQSVFFRKVFEKKLYSITFHAKCVISERI